MADLVKRLDHFVNCTLLGQAKARSVTENTLFPRRDHSFFREVMEEAAAF